MALNTARIEGSGVKQAAIINAANIESVIHAIYAYNNTGGDLTFKMYIDDIEIINESVPPYGSTRLPDRINLPVGVTFAINAETGVYVNISYYSQPLDIAAAQTSLQTLVDDQRTYLDTSVSDVETAVASISPYYGDITTVVTNIAAIQDAPNQATAAAGSAVTAESQATLAAASANNKGNWSALTGALNIPATVNHNNEVWILNTNLADVTASEPTDVNTDWTKFIGERINDYDGGNPFTTYSSVDIVLESGGV